MLNQKDKKILLNLAIDGRASYSEIGKNVGMTRQTVFSRIKTLKKKRIIEKFSTQIDRKALGLKLKAFVFISASPEKNIRKQLENRINKIPQISQASYLYGRSDVLLEFIVKDIEELTKILKDLRDMSAVNKTETFIVYETIKYNPEDPIKKVLNEGIDNA
jgi:DNA-binding Lrp family transcriptional regulator